VPKQVAVALCALPIFALRAVPAILLERRLAFGRLVVIEVSETISFYAFAVPAAIAGLGAWSLIGALPCSAVVGVVVAMIVRPWRLGVSLHLALLRPVLAFGAQAAAIWPIDQLRELGVVTGLAALGGQSLAGFYGMSQRLLSIPKAIQYAVWRVSVAGLSREVAAERQHRAIRAVAVTLIAVALPLAAIAGGAQPLIATLFGHRWVPTSTIVLWAVPGTLLTVGVWSLLSALALAEGDARSPLVGAGAGALTGVLVAVTLASSLDTAAAGISITAGALVATLIILIRTTADAGACVRLAARALLIMGAAIAVGQLMPGGQDAVGALVAVLASSAAWLCLAALISRDELILLFRLLRRHAIPGMSGTQPQGEPQPSSP
jgi:O-antigen/teichoic acid export membrane protein